MMSEVEVKWRHRRLERFHSDVDHEDAEECVALLRRRARELGRPVDQLTLRVRLDGAPRFRREYRA
jgi:hypothetical protein